MRTHCPSVTFATGLKSLSGESKDTDHKSFGYFDILLDENVRQGLKEYSSWPTYPQVEEDCAESLYSNLQST